MNFGEAIEKMKSGWKVSREEWGGSFFKGKKPFIFIGRHTGIATNTALTLFSESVENEDCIMYCTKKGKYQTNWMPTHEDMLADDWVTYTDIEEIDMCRRIMNDKTRDFSMEISCLNGWEIVFKDSAEFYTSKKVKIGKAQFLNDCRYTLAFEVCGMKPFEDYRNALICGKLFSVYCIKNIPEETVTVCTLPISYEVANEIIRYGDVRIV